MPLQLPTDLEALVQKRLASGAYASAEEVIRRALEAQEAEDSWTEEERRSPDAKIDRALEQVASGKTYGPEEARQKLGTMRETHLANLIR
jgi:Arc/MetJ-type ribon-helix-helix transcriptional regulator